MGTGARALQLLAKAPGPVAATGAGEGQGRASPPVSEGAQLQTGLAPEGWTT